MSINNPEQRTNQSLPPYPHDKRDTVIPPPEHRDDKHDKKGLGWKKPFAAGAAVLAAVGGGLAFNSMAGGEEAPKKAPAQTLVLGPDGEPVQYVEYSSEHSDRDNNGVDDFYSLGPDNINDSLQLWDQDLKEFVNPGEDQANEILAGASAEDLASIATIESTFPDFQVGFHWKADFVQLDLIVKNYIMNVVNSPEDFATPSDHEVAVMAGFDMTAEYLESYLN